MTQRKTDINGFMEVKNNPISKVGVFPYSGASIAADLDPGKLYNVYRPEEELADPECINSFRLQPFVDEHTMLGDGHTAAEDKGIHGVIGEDVYFADGKLFANLKVFSDSLRRKFSAGKTQLSAGYRCAYEKAAGTFNGQTYDFIQRNIRGNHLALVHEGRMGPDVAVLDHFKFAIDAKELDTMAELQQVMDALEKLTKTVTTMQTAQDEMCAKMKKDDDDEKKAAEDKAAADKAASDQAAADAAAAALAAGKDAKPGMDAAEVNTIVETRIAGLRNEMYKSVLTEIGPRDALAAQLVPFVGVFDHAGMTRLDVAKYAVEKLSIPAQDGTEITAVEAYLHGRQAPNPNDSFGMDAGSAAGAGDLIDSYITGK